MAYFITTIAHARQQTGYRPDAEDWFWYIVLPLLTYAALLVFSYLLPRDPHPTLFAIAATALLLLFLGIHNAWDTVTYVAITHWRRQHTGGKDNQ